MKEITEILENATAGMEGVRISFAPDFVQAFREEENMSVLEFNQQVAKTGLKGLNIEPPEPAQAVNNLIPIVLKYFGGNKQFYEYRPGCFKTRDVAGTFGIHEIQFKNDTVGIIGLRKEHFGTYRGTGWQFVGSAFSEPQLSMLSFDEIAALIQQNIKANRIAASLKEQLLLQEG